MHAPSPEPAMDPEATRLAALAAVAPPVPGTIPVAIPRPAATPTPESVPAVAGGRATAEPMAPAAPQPAPEPAIATAPHPSSVATPEASVPLVWQAGDLILEVYRVDAVLGQGAFGTVYKVHHLGWDMDLAVKTPNPDALDTHGADIFTGEAETWSELGLHPHIVSCYYVRNLGGVPRAFAEFIDGGSLQEMIQQGRVDALATKLDIAIQFAWGLAYAHGRSLVHKDVKPANVMLTRDGRVKVTDFGLTAAKGASGGGEDMEIGGGQTILVDGTGCTPAYAAPEQLAGEPVSRAADAWSFGVSVLAMFTGGAHWRVGAAAPTILEDLLGTADGQAPPMPDSLAALLRECFAIAPDQRMRDMGEIADRLIAIYRDACGGEYPRQAPRQDQVRSADSLVNRALSQLDLGHRDQAISLLQEALALQPHHPEATYNLGLLRWRAGEIFDSDLVTQLEEVRRSHADAWIDELLLSHVHLERGDILSAHAVLAEADPDQPEIRKTIQALPDIEQYSPVEVEFSFSYIFGQRIHASCIDPQGVLVLADANRHRLIQVDLRGGSARFEPFDQPEDFTGEKFIACCPEKGLVAAANIRGMVILFDSATRKPIRILQPERGEPANQLAKDQKNKLCFCRQGQFLLGIIDGVFYAWRLEEDLDQRIEVEDDKSFTEMAGTPQREIVLLSSMGGVQALDLTTGERKRIPTSVAIGSPIILTPDATTGFVISTLSATFSGEPVLVGWHAPSDQCRELQRTGLNQFGSLDTTPTATHVLLGGGFASTAGYFYYRLFDVQTGRALFTHSRKGGFHSTARLYRCDDSGFQVTELVKVLPGKLIFSRRLLAPSRRATFAVCRISASERIETEQRRFETAMEKARQTYADHQFRASREHLASARAVSAFSRDAEAMDLWRRLSHRMVRGRFKGGWLTREIPEITHERIHLMAGGNHGLFFRWENNVHNAHRMDLNTGAPIATDNFDIAASQGGGNWFTCDRSGILFKDTFEAISVIDADSGSLISLSTTGKEVGRLRAISPDGAYYLVGFVTRHASLWCARTGRRLRTHPIKGHLLAAGFSGCGRAVYMHTQGDGLMRWDIATGDMERFPLPGMGYSFHLCVRPGGSVVVLGEVNAGHGLMHHDPASGETRQAMLPQRGAGEGYPGMGLCPDGKTLAICCEQGKIVLWDLETWQLITELNLPVSGVNTQFARDAFRLVTCGRSQQTSIKPRAIIYALDWELDDAAPGGLDRAAHLMEAFRARQCGRGMPRPFDEQGNHRAADTTARAAIPAYGPMDLARLRVEIALAGYGDWPVNAIETHLRTRIPESRPCPLDAILTRSANAVGAPDLLIGARLADTVDMLDFYREQGIDSGETVLATMIANPGDGRSARLIVTDAKLRWTGDDGGHRVAMPLFKVERLSLGRLERSVTLAVNGHRVLHSLPADMEPALAVLMEVIRDSVYLIEEQKVIIGDGPDNRQPVAGQQSTNGTEVPLVSNVGGAVSTGGENVSAAVGASSIPEWLPDCLPDNLVHRALAFLEMNQPHDARDCLETALKLQPHHPEASYHLGLLRWRAGEILDLDLVYQLREVRASHVDSPTAALALGLIEMERCDHGAAVTALEDVEADGQIASKISDALETCRRLAGDAADHTARWWNVYQVQPVMQPAIFCAFAEKSPLLILPFQGTPTADVVDLTCGKPLQRLTTSRGKTILSVALSADGRLALTGSDALTAELWEVATGACLMTFDYTNTAIPGRPNSGIHGVHISRDARTILTCGIGAALTQWDADSGERLRTLDSSEISWRVMCVSTDESIVAAAGLNGRIDLWEQASGKHLHTLKAPANVFSLACDGRHLICGSDGGGIQVYDVLSGQCLCQWKAGRYTVHNIALHQNGWLIGTGGPSQCPLALWDIRTGQCLRTYNDAEGGPSLGRKVIGSRFDDAPQIRISELHEQIGTISLTTRAFEIRPAPRIACHAVNEEEARTGLDNYRLAMLNAVACHATGAFQEAFNYLADARRQSGLHRLPGAMTLNRQLAMRLPRRRLTGGWQVHGVDTGHGSPITALAMHPSGSFFITGNGDFGTHANTFERWDLETGRCLDEFGGRLHSLRNFLLAPDGRRFVCTFGNQEEAQIWDLEARLKIGRLENSQFVNNVQIGPCGRFVVGTISLPAENRFQIGLWNMETGNLLRYLDEHTQPIRAVGISPDGETLGSYAANEKMLLWDVATGDIRKVFDISMPRPCGFHFAPGGHTLLFPGDERLAVFDTHDGRILRQGARSAAPFATAFVVPVDRRHALCTQGRRIHLFDLWNMDLKRTFEGHQAEVRTLAVTPDGQCFVSGDAGGNLRIWQLDWELESRQPWDWDIAAEPFLRDFLIRQRPFSGVLPTDRPPTQEEVTAYLTRTGKPAWNAIDVDQLIHTLQCAGLGWIRREGVEQQLHLMVAGF